MRRFPTVPLPPRRVRQIRIASLRWQRRAVFVLGGIAVGAAAVALALAADGAGRVFEAVLARFGRSPRWCLRLGVRASSWLARRYFPNAGGSGIPQAIAARQLQGTATRERLVSIRMAIGKIVLVLLGLLCGASIGREGPTVQVGASVMFAVGRLSPRRQPGLILAGAAAGVAAAFNTPLAGIVFGIEEMSRSFEARTSGVDHRRRHRRRADLARAARRLHLFRHHSRGAEQCRGMARGPRTRGGRRAARRRLQPGADPVRPRPARRLGAGHQGEAGVVRGGLRARCRLMRVGLGWGRVRDGIRPGAGVGAGRGGHAGRVRGAEASCDSGILRQRHSGGIFAPSLAVGAGLGANVAALMPGAPAQALVVLGMVAYFAGVVQAPITAFVIVAEMTNDHALVVPLMLAALIGYAASRLVCPEGVYHALARGFVEAGMPSNRAARLPQHEQAE